MSGPRWRRLSPGQYELRSAEGVLMAVVERSTMRRWSWWWEVFTEKVYAAGNAGGGMARAKSEVMTALAPKGAST